MKKGRRIISVILLFAMIVAMIPVEYMVSAAPRATYVLDTDGIDVGEEYLLVQKASNQNTYYALQGADSTKPGATTEVQLDGDQVIDFGGIENYLWTIEDNGAGTYNIKHGDKYLHITQYHAESPLSYKEEKFALNIGNNDFALQKNGEYNVYCKFPGDSYHYYLTKSENDPFTFISYRQWSLGYVDSCVRFYKKVETQQSNHTVSVITKLNNNNTNLSTFLGEDTELHILLDGSDQECQTLTNIQTGVYTVEVTENGTYSVFLVDADGVRVDTDMDVIVSDADGAAELSYYSVTYDEDGGDLHGMNSTEYHLAGSTVIAKAEATRDNFQFMGWKDQNGNIIAGKGVVTQSLDKELLLTAQWQTIDIDESLKTDYVIRYLLKGTYEELHVETKVAGAAINSKVDAQQNALKLDGYTYCGATINNVYYDKETLPALTLSKDETNNVLIIHYIPDPDMHLHKTAILEDDGTYTIEMEMFIHDNPVTTIVDLNAPLDIVLVLDQSGSMWTSGVYGTLQQSVNSFINLIAEHGRTHQTDHRIAVVGYGNDEFSQASGTGPIAGSYDDDSGKTVQDDGYWTNTGVFDAHGDFHVRPITGFQYTEYTGEVEKSGTYYTYSHGEYLVLTYHDVYRHMITESEAYAQLLLGEKIYGNVDGAFVELDRNPSGMWIYDDNKLYSSTLFFTRHEKVWTHRHGIEGREIHAYMQDGKFTAVDGHNTIYIREETTEANPEKSIYRDALIPVTMGEKGSGYVDSSFEKIVNNLGAKGQTYVSYGMEMANSIFAANPLSANDLEEGRQRVVVVFTDGKPGDSTNFDEEESNKGIYQAYIASNTYGAEVFTIGLYGNEIVDAESDQDYFMNGMSSNYPDAQSLNDVWNDVEYIHAKTGVKLDLGGPYYVKDGANYCLLRNVIGRDTTTPADRNYYSFWRYTNSAGQEVTLFKGALNEHPLITAVEENGKIKSQINGVNIYRKSGAGYQEAASDKYYFSSHDSKMLEQYFATIVRELTTKISEEVALTNDAFLRDVMGQGLVLTPGTKITVSYEEGVFLPDEKKVNWSGVRVKMDSLTISENASGTITSGDGIMVDGQFIPYITVYNMGTQNATDPSGADYRPHTVDIVGYDYSSEEWYLNQESPHGRRLIVTITRVEAQDDVVWNKPQTTNQNESGFWAVAENGEEYLLETFVQPSTVFVERAYVLDYGKELELSGWYFDSEGDKQAQVIHVDCEIENGMNWFNKNNPTIQNGSNYGNTKYGNVRIENGKMYYQPTTTQWGGYDEFYVFGNTWRNTVVSQNANENGNLWNKVTVIPANNIYYEDSFVTGQSNGANDISGFVYSGAWEFVNGENAGKNTETPEQLENTDQGGGVHGWTDAWLDDDGFSDDSAHVTGQDGSMGAKAQFTFTGTGVEVYTRTNEKSGIVVATLKSLSGTSAPVSKSLIVDNLAKSGDYYQIPTVSFADLEYGTYEVTLIATAASAVATGSMRYEYYLDGIRVYNPLGIVSQDSNSIVKDAYGKELNAMYTEIRDIVIANDDFIPDLNNDGVSGAVFIDWIQEGQENGDDVAGVGAGTYEVSTTFQTYGPKNEIYLEKGQAVVIKVDSKNTYYVGMKSIDADKAAKVNICGLEMKEPQTITVSHTVDMYYEVVPIDGYLVIQNASENGALLALTKLKTTNLTEKITTNGVLPVVAKYAVRTMELFDLALEEAKNKPVETPVPEVTVDPLVLYQQRTDQLFEEVRSWLEETE